MELLVSDDHAGLRSARRAVFPSVPWQRCQFHLSQNAQRMARNRSEKRLIAQVIKDIHDSPTREDAEEMLRRRVQNVRKWHTKLADWIEENIPEGLTAYDFPRAIHRRVRTINGLENLNKQIRRRTRVVGIFPNEASALRLITAVLSEIHDDWITGRSYVNWSRCDVTENQTLETNYRKSFT